MLSTKAATGGSRVLVVLVCLLCPSLAVAQLEVGAAAITEARFPACLLAPQLDHFREFMKARDTASMRAYIESGDCLLLKGGLTVTVLSQMNDNIQFAFRGQTYWAPKGALTSASELANSSAPAGYESWCTLERIDEMRADGFDEERISLLCKKLQ